jgi:hypothetical protein
MTIFLVEDDINGVRRFHVSGSVCVRVAGPRPRGSAILIIQLCLGVWRAGARRELKGPWLPRRVHKAILSQHKLYLCDSQSRIQILRTCISAVHDGVAAV